MLQQRIVGKDFNMGVLVLSYKKGDRELSCNWRPIMLLNTDDKILSKVLTLQI